MTNSFIKVGTKVRHNMTGAVATVVRVRKRIVNREEGLVPLFCLNFGHSVKGPFCIEMNMKEYRREAFCLA